MGWFDESDSEDERPQSENKPQNHEQEEDEDPLDAYMKSLESSKVNEESCSQQAKAPRLDVLNEEEATEHWKEKIISTNSNGKDNDVESFDDVGDCQGTSDPAWVPYVSSQKASEARQAISNTFHKAGAKKHCEKSLDEEWNSQKNKPIIIAESKKSVSEETFDKCFWTGFDTTEGQKWRQENDVKWSYLNHQRKSGLAKILDPIYDFHELRDVFGEDLLRETLQHYSKPTPVQSQTLPLALSGFDLVATAATGQGKSLAYLWPIAVHLAHQPPLQQDLGETGPIALVLVPTRELAIQVQKQAKPVLEAAIAKQDKSFSGVLSSRAVIGGQGKYLLRQELKKTGGVDLVIATPGRLLDVLSDKKGLSLQRVTFVVLDEADKMLNMGFEADVRQILSNIRKSRQTLMLSATMGRKVEKVATEWLQPDSLRISVGRTGEASHNVDQHVMVLPNEEAKKEFVIEMLPTLVAVGRTLIFVATRESCESLAKTVSDRMVSSSGVVIQTLHGDKHQSDRNAAVRAFTRGEVNVLIATDVAGRGLDIPNVQTVLSFDPAKNLDAHVHRVGRAGRLSKDEKGQQTGSAYTLLTNKNADFAHVLRNAFEREGRLISPELDELAMKSRRSGNVAARNKWNKSGLGHDRRDITNDNYSATKQNDSNNSAPLLHHSHPEDPFAPQPKRSRWS